MVVIIVTNVFILGLQSIFDLKALKQTQSRKAWTVYLGITCIGLILVSMYVLLFDNPLSPLVYLERLLKPATGWLST